MQRNSLPYSISLLTLRSAAGQRVWLEETQAGRKFHFTLWFHRVKNVAFISVRLRWISTTEHACFSCYGSIWMQTMCLNSQNATAQQPRLVLANTKQTLCGASTHTMWPNRLERRAKNTHHSIVQQSKNQCNKRHTVFTVSDRATSTIQNVVQSIFDDAKITKSHHSLVTTHAESFKGVKYKTTLSHLSSKGTI